MSGRQSEILDLLNDKLGQFVLQPFFVRIKDVGKHPSDFCPLLGRAR